MNNSDHMEQHDQLLKEEAGSILECLGFNYARVFSIEKTSKGYRFVEECDQYYGVTLNQEQMGRLIKELQQLAAL